MLKRYQSWFAGIGAACCSVATLACGDAGTLLGTHRYTLTADAPVVLRIDQNGTDLLIALDNAAGTTLFNHPNERAGFELLYLTAADGTTQDVCVHSVYRNPDIRTPYAITRLDVAAMNAATLESLRRFGAAAQLWANPDRAARKQALAEYAALSATEFPFRNEARLYVIRAELLDSQFDSALQHIAAYAQQPAAGALPAHILPWYRGFALLRQRAFAGAIDALTRARALAADPLDIAEIENLLGEAYLGHDQVDEGERHIAAALAASGSDHSLLARVHNNRGYVLLRRAYAANLAQSAADQLLQASIDEHLVARAFALNAGDTAEQLMIDNNLGTLYERARELRKAHYHYREALRMTEAADDPFALRVLYQNLGTLNQRLGDYQKSRAYLEQALRLAGQVGDPAAYRVNCLLGTTYQLLGDFPQALAIHETCRDRAAGRQDYPALIEAFADLSDDYLLAAHDPAVTVADKTDADDNAYTEAAWSSIDAARSLLDQHQADIVAVGRTAAAAFDPRADNLCTMQRSTEPQDNGVALNETALYLTARVLNRHALLAQRHAAADTALDDLLLAAGMIGNARYSGQIDILDSALRVYRAQGNIEFARACGERALTLIERLHEDLEAERNGPAWSAKTHEIYVALADMLLAEADAPALPALSPASLSPATASPARTSNDNARAAFAVAERAMGISLRQHLSLPPGANRESEDAHLRAVLSTLADEHAALSAEQKARLLPVSYYHQHDLVERSRLGAQQRVPIPPALPADAVQARLREGQTVLYYYIGGTDAWLFQLDTRAFGVRKLGPAATLTALLAAVEQDLRSANGTPSEGLRALSAFLLPASLQLAGTQELLIVPHRDLYKIPFAALAQGSGYRPLIEDFAVKTTPSLTAYFMDKRTAPAAHSADLAVFADPLFNTADLRGAAAELVAGNEALQTWSSGLERLPYTELEAESLKALFQPEHTLEFLGNRATLDNLGSAAARNARILHIATHGYFLSTGSDNVGLVLSSINERNERVPGFVTLTELFGHSFNNELVVISGCDTAMGMQLAGEGMMGVTRGFLAQGARHVISTLWPVSDRASAKFMALFYASLRSSGSVAQALRSAQLQLKALPEFRHPYYWAPYVLTTVSPVDAMRFEPEAAPSR